MNDLLPNLTEFFDSASELQNLIGGVNAKIERGENLQKILQEQLALIQPGLERLRRVRLALIQLSEFSDTIPRTEPSTNKTPPEPKVFSSPVVLPPFVAAPANQVVLLMKIFHESRQKELTITQLVERFAAANHPNQAKLTFSQVRSLLWRYSHLFQRLNTGVYTLREYMTTQAAHSRESNVIRTKPKTTGKHV